MGNTWQVKNGFSSTIVISILLLGLLTGTLERLFRTSQLQHALPIPSVSQNQKRHFDLQVALLHDYIAQHGTPTCFILGSSMAQRGLQPAILESHLKVATWQHPGLNMALILSLYRVMP